MWNIWEIFASEFMGTVVLLLLGGGVVATALLPKSKGRGGGWLMISVGWAVAVFAGIYVAWKTGGHLNPAITWSKVVAYWFDHDTTMNGAEAGSAAAIPVTFGFMLLYWFAQLLGAFVGAVLVWLAFKKQFDEEASPATKLGVFATGPEVRSNLWNFMTEGIITAVLVLFILVAGGTPTVAGPLAVSLVFLGTGVSLGGPTGYAFNPARDLGARLAHTVLPIPGKGSSDWNYAWVPLLGPIVGATVAVLVFYLFGLGVFDLASLGA